MRKLSVGLVVSLLVALAVLVIIPHLGVVVADGWARIQHYLEVPLFDIGKQPLTTLTLVKILIFVAVLGFVSGSFKSFLEKRLLVHTSLEEGQRYALARITSYVVFVLGAVIGLESTGLDLSSLVVLGGALGLGVGLGLQTVVSNFVAGLILLLEQPVRVGDRIEVGDTYGDVVALKGRSTWIRTNDNVVIIVPNSNFIEQSVTNWTANDRQVRVNIPVGVAYNCSPAEVRDVMLRVAVGHPDVLSFPAPDVVFEEFGDSSLNFSLRVWTTSRVHMPKVLRSDIYFALFAEFGKLGIEIPFPQRDLHLRSIDPEAARALRG
ncbi:MAG: mechanosensitive ion channel [Acidobacteriota bacterium]|nr:mechanosensitive ion channel [Acidobacteriota bacterium]